MQPTRADGCLHHRLKLPDANQDASGAFFTHAITTPRKQRLLTAGRGTNLYVSRSAGILPAHRLASAFLPISGNALP